MRNIMSYVFSLLFVVSMPSIALAGDLQANDFVGVTFWIISISMVAATVFFYAERSRVSAKWQTSLSVISLVTLIAAVHYFYMRDVWVSTGESPTVFRYIDWILTVPLQMIEFYLILAAVTTVSVGVFNRLLVGTLVMLIGGYLGEAGVINAMLGFIIGMAGWIYILYEIFMGEASQKRYFMRKRRCTNGIQRMSYGCISWLGDLSSWIPIRISNGRSRRSQLKSSIQLS